MYNCSSSFFLSLPVFDVRVARPRSDNCTWRIRQIQHSIIHSYGRSHVSVHETNTRARCYFGDLTFFGKFRSKEKSSDRFVSRLSSSLPNEKDVVHDTVDSSQSDFLENDSAEFPRDGDLIRIVGENDLKNTGSRGFKQTMTRSNLVAKQVISIQSALSLGFISQLWVDTTSVSFCGSFTKFVIEEDKHGEAIKSSTETV